MSGTDPAGHHGLVVPMCVAIYPGRLRLGSAHRNRAYVAGISLNDRSNPLWQRQLARRNTDGVFGIVTFLISRLIGAAAGAVVADTALHLNRPESFADFGVKTPLFMRR